MVNSLNFGANLNFGTNLNFGAVLGNLGVNLIVGTSGWEKVDPQPPLARDCYIITLLVILSARFIFMISLLQVFLQ